jgi:hypothetical protein
LINKTNPIERVNPKTTGVIEYFPANEKIAISVTSLAIMNKTKRNTPSPFFL